MDCFFYFYNVDSYYRFKKFFIGETLAATDDVFEKVRIDVLFSFTLFFFITNIPYVFLTLSQTWFHIFLSVFSFVGLASVILILRLTQNVRKATIFYVCVHVSLNIVHFIINNGEINSQGVLFFVLLAIFSFIMLDRKWGYIFTLFILTTMCIGVYNVNSHLSLFSIPEIYHDPKPTQGMSYLLFIPMLINIYLISQFVKATKKAEEQIHKQKMLLELNNKNLSAKNEDIVASINYAKKIQSSVLPNEENIFRTIPLSFIFYRPRDIVSGDFFWFHEIDRDNYILVAADCTGHGVPGAFMTVIGSNMLTQIVKENKITQPSQILAELDQRITATLRQEKTHHGLIQDGMDIALLKVNKAKRELVFTSAKRPAFFLRDGQIRDLKGSKSSIGGLRSEEKKFNEISVTCEEDDMIYLFSDGVVDQFGGENNKKFTTKRFRELVLSLHQLPVAEQKLKIEETLSKWQGNNEQTDDMLAIGIRF